MKNIFSVFGGQSTTSINENVAIDLNEQDLEQVNGACGDDCHYDDDDCYSDGDDWDYDHSDHWNRRHHRHHHHS